MMDTCWIKPSEYIPGTIASLPRVNRGRGNPSGKGRTFYKDCIVAFDIETSRLTREQSPVFAPADGESEGSCEWSIMYLWQLCLYDHCIIIGRTWDELSELLHQFKSELGKGERLVLWVHNLSYEFQFLRGIYDFQKSEVFAVKSRKVLRALMWGCIEFRCSYLHSNMSLGLYTKKMKVGHPKLSGDEFDYNAIRYPWTPLTDDQLRYGIHDVLGLCECIKTEMEIDGDNLYTIPSTSTGYVRRDAKEAMKPYRNMIREITPDFEVYKMLREAFRGGNTHANRYYAGRVLYDVKSADRSSSYPDVQCNREFPVGRWYHVRDLEDAERLNHQRHKAVVMQLVLYGVRLRDNLWGCPYISFSGCRNVSANHARDNGRIIYAEKLEITVTDIDWDIIKTEYVYDHIVFLDGFYSRYGTLPEELKRVAINYYKSKTELKGVDGAEILYHKAKNKLNSIYGMTAQDPGKIGDLFIDGDWIPDETPIEDVLEKNTRRAFITYAWGVWTTAWARYELECGIRLAGDKFVYCDTDSVKYLGDIDWSDYNADRVRASTESGAYATDPKGITHYMGVYEQEDTYKKFATLGSKKYCFDYGHGTQITIAGVTKAKGGAELDRGDQYGKGIERFCMADEYPFTFYDAGGTEIYYHDHPLYDMVDVPGGQIKRMPCAVIRQSTYTLGITADYKKLIKGDNTLDDWTKQW